MINLSSATMPAAGLHGQFCALKNVVLGVVNLPDRIQMLKWKGMPRARYQQKPALLNCKPNRMMMMRVFTCKTDALPPTATTRIRERPAQAQLPAMDSGAFQPGSGPHLNGRRRRFVIAAACVIPVFEPHIRRMTRQRSSVSSRGGYGTALQPCPSPMEVLLRRRQNSTPPG